MNTMTWLNKPREWRIEDRKLTLFVTPSTDYWRQTHYGFTVDDGPFCFESVGGDFEVKAKLTGSYKSRFDQMGLMLRIDERNWIKAGVEYVNDRHHISAVVTRGKSDWSMVELHGVPHAVWVKAVRRLDAVEFSYSLDNSLYRVVRLAPFPDNKPVMAGLFAASPDGQGFHAVFEGFELTHFPDTRRSKWLHQTGSGSIPGSSVVP